MPWPSLVPPTAGTVITVAWESAQVNDPLLWLRLLTGNADPPGPSYVVVSSGTASTAWGKVTGDVLGPGAAVANIGYAPVSKLGDTMSGSLTAAGLSSTAGIGAVGNIVSSAGSISAAGNVSATGNLTTTSGTVQGSSVQATFQFSGPSAVLTGNIQAASANITGTATISAVSAASIGSSGNIVSSGGSISAAGNVSATGNITTTTGTVLGSIVQATSSMNVGGQTVWNAGHFAQPQATPAANRVPISDASGKLDAGWLPAQTIAGVPNGLIAMWASAEATVPAGWTVNHTLDGRFIVGVGGSVGATLGAAGGATQHGHTMDTRHTHASANLSVGGSISASTDANGTAPGAGNSASHGHAHAHTLDVAGTTDETGSASAAVPGTANNHLPPYYALFYIQKV